MSDITATPPLRDNLRGILWMLGSVVASSAMTVSVRVVSEEVASPMVLILRAGISAALILLIVVPFSPLRRHLRFSRPRDHLIRGVFIAFATLLGFWTIASIPLATATVLFFTAPIFAVLLSVIFLKEKVGPRRWGAVIAGFCGAVVILRPGMEGFHPAMLGALGSSSLFASALTMSRGLAQADGAFSAFVSSVFITVALILPIAWPVLALPQSTTGWVATAVLVITGGLRNIADIEAYRHGDAAVVGPVSYLRLVLIGAAGYVLFTETIDLPTLIGAAIIVGSTFYIAERARRTRGR